MTENPWTTHDSRVVYKNDWITVREDAVTRPDGKAGIYGVVETRLATGVIALTKDEDLYLVGQYRYPMGCYSWEIPEGGSDPGEEPLEACKRELLEEAGLTAEKWEPLGGEVHLSNCHSSERAYLFVARDLHVGEAAPEGTERLQVRRVPWMEALAMVDSGEIQDAISIIAILRYDRVRRRAEKKRRK